MKRQVVAVVVLQFVVIIGLFWSLVLVGRDEYETHVREPAPPPAPSRTAVEDGAVVVRLSLKTQQQSGIATAELAPVEFRPGVAAFAAVVGIDSLLEMRGRHLAARAEAEVARAALANSQRDAERLRQLNRDERNVADRVADAAEAQARGDAARLAAAEALAANLRDGIRQQWPEPLAGWATELQAAAPLRALIEAREVLLDVSLPDAAPAPDQATVLELTPAGAGGKPLRARYVGPAAQTAAAFPGRSHLFRAPGAGLRPGMRVAVRVHGRGAAVEGVVVPAAAIVWYAGKAWAYEQDDDDKEEFVRRPVAVDHEVGDGWFVAGGFEPGDRVVVSGAQLLLSEEFKYQITNENDD